jgi:hypothetical protein
MAARREMFACKDRSGKLLGVAMTTQGAMACAPKGNTYAIVRGEYTSDGSYHGVGRGRQTAVREFDPSGGFRWYVG